MILKVKVGDRPLPKRSVKILGNEIQFVFLFEFDLNLYFVIFAFNCTQTSIQFCIKFLAGY
jgi:hypothetical protein